MVLGTHNSMSYLHDRRWWMRPFEPWARCQSKDIFDQYADGVRYFDLRIRFDKNGNPFFCHGLVEYELCGMSVYDLLRWLNAAGSCYIRILYEGNPADDHAELLYNVFQSQVSIMDLQNLIVRLGTKQPFSCNPFQRSFKEIAKHFDVKWHFILTPLYWAKRTQYERYQEQSATSNIVAMDFYHLMLYN